MSLIVTGSIGIDTVITPTGRADNVLGGSCTYFAAAASFFTPVRIVAAVGEDFPREHLSVFDHFKVDTAGLEIRDGAKTFRWTGEYHQNMNDRDTLEVVSKGEAEAWFQWHFGNGYVDADGNIHLDFVRHEDFPHTNEYLRELAFGDTHTRDSSTLWRMTLDPKTAQLKTLEQVMDRDCEFPVVPAHQVGQPWQHTYLAVHQPGTDITREWYRAIARFDYQSGELTTADCGENNYVMEPLYARDRYHPDQGWVLTVVYDGDTDTSEVWVFDSDRLNQEPVCRLSLPQVIPIGFHGTWRPA